MSDDRTDLLARRRERLVLRSARLRGQLATELQTLQPALAWADRVQDAWLWLRAHPLAVAAGALTLVVWRPRRLLGLGLRAWSAWKLMQRLRSVAHGAGRLF